MSRWAEFGYPDNLRLGESYKLHEGMAMALSQRNVSPSYSYRLKPPNSRLSRTPLFCYESPGSINWKFWRQKVSSGSRIKENTAWTLDGLYEEIVSCTGMTDAVTARLTPFFSAQERYMSYIACNWLRYRIAEGTMRAYYDYVSSSSVSFEDAWLKMQNGERVEGHYASPGPYLYWNNYEGQGPYVIMLKWWNDKSGMFTPQLPSSQGLSWEWWDMGTGAVPGNRTIYYGDEYKGIGQCALSLPFSSLPIAGNEGTAGMWLPDTDFTTYENVYFSDHSASYSFFDDCDHLLGGGANNA